MDKGKLICVWGSNGSGKTFVSSGIGSALAKKDKRVIILNADPLMHGLRVALPNTDFTYNNSLTHLLNSNAGLTDRLITQYIFTHKNNDNLAYMGFCDGDTLLGHAFSPDRLFELFDALCSLADYVIVDSTSNPTDIVTDLALTYASQTVRVINTDVKSISFAAAVLPAMRDKRYNTEQHICVLNAVKHFSATKEMHAAYSAYGNISYVLPYLEEAEERHICGELLNSLPTKTGKQINSTLEALAERVSIPYA